MNPSELVTPEVVGMVEPYIRPIMSDIVTIAVPVLAAFLIGGMVMKRLGGK